MSGQEAAKIIKMANYINSDLLMQQLTQGRRSPELNIGNEAWGSEDRIPEVTMVGTVLVMELGGASIPDGCSGGRGGGGPVLEDKIKQASYK